MGNNAARSRQCDPRHLRSERPPIRGNRSGRRKIGRSLRRHLCSLRIAIDYQAVTSVVGQPASWLKREKCPASPYPKFPLNPPFPPPPARKSLPLPPPPTRPPGRAPA